jgi:L-fuculose-phosphate aldolase
VNITRHFSTVGKDLFHSGLVGSHGGNLSVRIENELIITRTGAMLAHISGKDLVRLPLTEYDKRGASKELPVHRAVYTSTEAKALVHAHPPFSIALSLTEDEIVPKDSEGIYLLSKINVVEVKDPIGSQELADKVAESLVSSPVVVVRSHGTFARGDDLWEAYQYTSALEASCKILWLLGLNFPLFDTPQNQ